MNEPMFWIEVTVPAASECFEAVGNFLFEHGSCGIEEGKEVLRGYFRGDFFSDKLKTLLEFYIENLREMGFSVGSPAYRNIPAENWNQNWKNNFKPVQITSRIVVKPPWEKWNSKSNQIVINIIPKMAFGTGTHETTQMLLELLENYLRPSQTILDIGTGSGILAIAGAKLGASRVLGVEIDKDAVENARENVVYNKVEHIVEIRSGSIETIGAEKFDVILSNIDRITTTKLLPKLEEYILPTTALLFSGFLTADKKGMEKIFSRSGYRPVTTKSKGEWLSFVVYRE